MAKFLQPCLLAALLVGVTLASAVDNKVDEDQGTDEEAVMPSMFGMLGSKVGVAETIYDEYSEEDDSDEEETDDEDNDLEEAPTAPCCFPKVWQGRLKSDFGYVPVGGRGGGKDSFGGDDDDDKKGKKHKGGKGGKGRKRGRAGSARAIDLVFVDGTNRRLAGEKTVFADRPGKPLNFSYIVLLGANRSADLYLFNRSAQKCRHRKLANIDWHQQCLPANSTLRGTFSLGPKSGGLNVQSWTFEAGRKRVGASIVSGEESSFEDNVPGEADGSSDDDDEYDELFGAAPPTTKRPPRPRPPPRPRVSVRANVLVVPGSCTPVVIQEEGVVIVGGRGDESNFEFINKDGKKPKPKPKPSKPRGEAFIGSVYFSDFQTSISDPNVFTPPSYCSTTSNKLYFDNMEDELPALLERFLVL